MKEIEAWAVVSKSGTLERDGVGYAIYRAKPIAQMNINEPTERVVRVKIEWEE